MNVGGLNFKDRHGLYPELATTATGTFTSVAAGLALAGGKGDSRSDRGALPA
ncbi:MAG: hypothetical protein IH866_06255 [Chloroflexi bacterium]|nr:hypothetical protein [Chloroflexota bacterium]